MYVYFIEAFLFDNIKIKTKKILTDNSNPIKHRFYNMYITIIIIIIN